MSRTNQNEFRILGYKGRDVPGDHILYEAEVDGHRLLLCVSSATWERVDASVAADDPYREIRVMTMLRNLAEVEYRAKSLDTPAEVRI